MNVAYEIGVENFLKYASEKSGGIEKIKCPCVKCLNASFGSLNMVKDHLLTYGIIEGSTMWKNYNSYDFLACETF